MPVSPGASITFAAHDQKGGAALLHSSMMRTEDTRDELPLRQFLLKHCNALAAFGRYELGRDITVEDLIMVTGTDMVHDWANVILSSSSGGGRITFVVADLQTSAQTPHLWGSWSKESLYSNVTYQCSPPQVGSQLTTSPPNQCIFLRGLKVHMRRTLPFMTKKAVLVDISGLPIPEPAATPRKLS